ncbi:MAG: Ig-like domain-containing protein [Candidatus Bipolaricaulota bacterium]
MRKERHISMFKYVLTVMILLASCGWFVTGQPLPEAPEAPLQVIVVPFGTPVSFEIWTPIEAEADDLSFVLVKLPAFGTLLGIPPELIFIPDPDFHGTDSFSFVVDDPSGQFDIANVQIIVLQPEVETSPPVVGLSGGITASGMPVSLDLHTLNASYSQRFPYFDQEFRAELSPEEGLTSFTAKTELEFVIPVDPVIRVPVSSTFDFDPTIPALSSWTLDAKLRMPDFDGGWTVYYDGDDPEEDSYHELQLRGDIDGIRAESQTRFAWLTPRFSQQTLTLSGPASAFGCPGCDFRVESFLSFSKETGFEEFRLTARDIRLPMWFGDFDILLDLRVSYTPDDKTFTPSLKLRRAVHVHLRPLISLDAALPSFTLSDVNLFGVEVHCELPDGQGLRLATSFDESKDASVTGASRFFEVWRVYGPVLPCCGARGRWQISTFFKRDGDTLFGWGMTEAVVHFPLSDQVLLNLTFKGGELDATDSAKTWSLALGMKGLW